MQNFHFLEDTAIAESAFEAFGETEEELFENAAIALFEIMADTKNILPKQTIELRLFAKTLNELLFKWLSELVFLKDAHRMVFGRFEVQIKKQKEFKLSAKCFGKYINYPDERLRGADAKAITKHLFKIEKEKGKFKATVVVDI